MTLPLSGRRVGTFAELTQAGDYCGPVMGYTADIPAVFFLKPNARDAGVSPNHRAIQHVVSPPHRFQEEPDGTLSIFDSIGDMHPWGTDRCHCFLRHGVWLQA